ncbi:MAG: hypothetical protein JXB17_08410 [Bacteroidales bacterium]|nr:hypothetical protein [Bacteroidales bacterium]
MAGLVGLPDIGFPLDGSAGPPFSLCGIGRLSGLGTWRMGFSTFFFSDITKYFD